MKSIRILSFSGPCFPIFRLNTDQKNYEYGLFSRSVKQAFTFMRMWPTFSNFIKKTFQYGYFAVSFEKFIRTRFYRTSPGNCFCWERYVLLFTETSTRFPIFYFFSYLASEHEALNYNELSWCAYQEKDIFVWSWEFWISLENKTIISYSIIITRPE